MLGLGSLHVDKVGILRGILSLSDNILAKISNGISYAMIASTSHFRTHFIPCLHCGCSLISLIITIGLQARDLVFLLVNHRERSYNLSIS